MSACPFCMFKMEHVGAAYAHRPPEPNDVVFCGECLSFSIIKADFNLRKPNKTEEKRIYKDERCLKILESASQNRVN